MPPKWKGAAAKNKKEAPPAKTTRGKKKIGSRQGKVHQKQEVQDKPLVELQREVNKPPVTIAIGLNAINPEYSSSDDSSDEELLYGDYSRWLASDEMAQDADYIGMEITPEDEEMFDKFSDPFSKAAQEEVKRWYRIHRDADGNLLANPVENPYDSSISEKDKAPVGHELSLLQHYHNQKWIILQKWK